MKITTIGRGTIGGGLARFWAEAGHEVTSLGREGGDAADARRRPHRGPVRLDLGGARQGHGSRTARSRSTPRTPSRDATSSMSRSRTK